MVTAPKRLDYFRKSYQCFLDQTYPNRELLILNEGPQEYQEAIAEIVSGNSNVRTIFLKGEYTLGALRNISIGLADGEIFVQWDDDDFNAPERLMVQYGWLARNPHARACFLSDQLHYIFPRHELYWNNWKRFGSGGWLEYSLIPGTIMAYRDGFDFYYPSVGTHCRAGEDSILAWELCDKRLATVLEGFGYLHVYSFHGNNVWPIDHHIGTIKVRSYHLSHMLHHRKRIMNTLDYLKLGADVKVMGRDGLAFIHRGIN